jgi:hypothetical protein
MTTIQKTLSQVVRLLIVVIFLGVLLAYIDSEWLEPSRTPPCDPNSLAKGRICLSTAVEQWHDNIVWVDARNQDAFERGSVQAERVFSIRNDEHGQELLSKALPELYAAGLSHRCIIVFCDRSCNAATDVAHQLQQFDFQAPIYVLEGGWDEIRKFPSLAP